MLNGVLTMVNMAAGLLIDLIPYLKVLPKLNLAKFDNMIDH